MKLSDIVLCIEDLLHLLGCLFVGILKLALVIAVVLSPYALEYAMDKYFFNTLPPTVEEKCKIFSENAK